MTEQRISRLQCDRLDPYRHINIPAAQGGGQRERAICKQDYSVGSEAVKWLVWTSLPAVYDDRALHGAATQPQ